jgi:hypothetical protein
MAEFTTPEMLSLHIDDDFSSIYTEDLPDVKPHFFVPRLAEKPQNPILDTLKKLKQVHNSAGRQETPSVLPQFEDPGSSPLAQLSELGDIWMEIPSHPRPPQVSICPPRRMLN